MKTYFILIFTSVFLVNSVQTALAVPPPDFLFNVGSQVAQAFSIIVIFLSAALVSVRQFAVIFFQSIRHKKIFWASIAFIVIGISLTSAYFYGQYIQNEEYQKWIAQSKAQNEGFEITDYSMDKMKISRPTTDNETVKSEESLGTVAELPQTITNQAETSAKDPNEAFIRKYYENIGSGNLQAAYDVSKKQVSLEVFKGWYSNVTSAQISDIQNIDDKNYSVNVAITEGETMTNYAILMTLKIDNQGSVSISDSKVRVLGTEKVTAEKVADESDKKEDVKSTTLVENAQIDENFYINNKDLPLAITNQEFQQVIDSGNSIFVLDAREDEEYEIGYFKGSTQIRFADLVAGEWIKLPTDEVIYVFCWSGMRGQEVAKFLREKNIVARYIKTGADGWVTYGGAWNGGIKFLVAHPEDRYKRLFSYDELKDKMAAGTAIIDSRITNKYAAWHIPGSINIPIIYTPTSDIATIMSSVPKEASVITVCDDFISCFDAKITGLKLEKLGHEFLGRYSNPWEYRNNEK